MGGFGMGPGMGMMGGGFERPVEETVINNYYDQPGGGQEHFEHGGAEHSGIDQNVSAPFNEDGGQSDGGGAHFSDANYETSGDDQGGFDQGGDDGSGFDNGGSDDGGSGFDDGGGGGFDNGGGGDFS
jgi:hypothetical protein